MIFFRKKENFRETRSMELAITIDECRSDKLKSFHKLFLDEFSSMTVSHFIISAVY